MLMMFDERWDNVKGAPSKGGKALQRKYDPAREHARHLAAEIWRKNPTLAATKVVRMIENDFVAAAETRCFEVSIEPCSLRRSLKTWITKDSPLP
ncbi:hypothetical protein SAMN05880557_1246 [Pseudacidovorax sp. RU35E]|nr:hypothetical protein SAMN05880557_1246 [Pseudacidovorax sp. RU35E]